MQKAERLQKRIAQSGLTSRRKAEQLILDGKVKVNNKIVTTLGVKVFPTDEITVNDIPLEEERLVYYALYKPRGYITSVSDEKGRKTVIDLMEEVSERIFPVGRLDYQTSGLLLMTNDGEFAHRLMHPKYEVAKVYIAKIEGIPSKEELVKLRKGIKDKEDILRITQYKVKSVDRRKKTMILELTLHEGKNRHIRRMFDKLGYPVMKLSREKYGIVSLDKLQPGKYRPLTKQEVAELTNLTSQNVKQ